MTGMIENILTRVETEHKTRLTVSNVALEKITTWCLNDLSNGGRGIGNRLESILVNPLSRAIFEKDTESFGTEIRIEDVIEVDRVFSVVLS